MPHIVKSVFLNNVAIQFQRMRQDKMAADVVRGASAAFILKLVRVGLLFGLHAFLVRFVGVTIYGEYVYVIAWLEILALFGQAGFNNASLRFVSAYRGEGRWKLLGGVIRRSSQISFGNSLIIAAIAATIVWQVQNFLEISLVYAFWSGFLLLPIMVILRLSNAQLLALKRVVVSHLPEAVLYPIALILGVFISVEIFRFQPSASLILNLGIATLLILYLISRSLLSNCLPQEVLHGSKDYRTNEWIKVALPLLAVSAVNLVLIRTDVIMIGIFRSTTEVGVYTAASMIASIVPFTLVAANTIVAPVISELFTQHRMAELQSIITFVTRWIFMLTIPIVLGIMILGEFILSLFDPTFVSGYVALIILTLGQIINVFVGSVAFLLTMTNHQNIAAKVMGISAFMNIILNLMLVPIYGIMGAAIATAITMIFWNITMLVLVQKHLNINPSAFPLRRRRI